MVGNGEAPHERIEHGLADLLRRSVDLGATFAMAEAQIIMATLPSRFRIASDDGRSVLPVGRLTIEPGRAPNFKLEQV